MLDKDRVREKIISLGLGAQDVAVPQGLERSPHPHRQVAADLGGSAVAAGSPESSDTWGTGVTGEAWGALVTGRFGWPQESHEVGLPGLVPSFDAA